MLADVCARQPRMSDTNKNTETNSGRIQNNVVPMRYPVFALALFGSVVTQAQAADINFGEVRTRFQIQNDPAWKELQPPWAVNWRRTTLWQDGRTFRTEFAPRTCYITRYVTTSSGTSLQELFIC